MLDRLIFSLLFSLSFSSCSLFVPEPPPEKEDIRDPKIDAGQGVVPEVDAGQGVAPEVDAGQGVAPEVDAGQGVVPEVDAGQGAVPEVDAGQGVVPEVDAGQGVVPEVDAGQGVATNVDAGLQCEACEAGMELNSNDCSCTDINECATNNGECGTNADCENAINSGDDPSCTCHSGHFFKNDNALPAGGECIEWAVCTEGQYESQTPSEIIDRSCNDLSICIAGQWIKTEVLNDGTATSDRVCEDLTVCQEGEWISNDVPNDGTATADRECSPLAACEEGQGAQACIQINTNMHFPIVPHLSGLGTNLFHNGWQLWDERLVEAARGLFVGTIRIPGFSYGYDWRSGYVPGEFIMPFDPDKDNVCTTDTESTDCAGNESCVLLDDPDLPNPDLPYPLLTDAGTQEGRCRETCTSNDDCTWKEQCSSDICVGKKVVTYTSYQKTLKGKGYLKVYDFARFVDRIGAKQVVDINGFTGTPELSAGLVQDLQDKDISVVMWMLGDEPQYWTNPVLQFFTDGADYAEQMFAHAQAILLVDPNAVLALAFSDAYNQNQIDFDDSIATYSLNAGYSSDKYWHAVNTHFFPGNASQSMQEAMAEVNHMLHFEALPNIDNYFVPRNGIPGHGDPAPEHLSFAMTTSVRYTSALLGTIFGAVHAAEFVTRMSTHPKVQTTRYFSLTSQCIDVLVNHRNTMQKASNSNFGTVDSQFLKEVEYSGDAGPGVDVPYVVPYGQYINLACVALREVNRAVNGSRSRWETNVSGGLHVPVPVPEPEVDAGPGVAPTDVPALYSQTFRGNDGQAHMIITNRSGQDHQITITIDGRLLQGPLQTWHMGNPDPEFKTLSPDTAIEMTQTVMNNPVTVPAYGVMRVAWPLDNANIPAPSGFTASIPTNTPHAVDLNWGAVEGATGYRVKYGVRSSFVDDIEYYSEEILVPAQTGQTLSHRVERLGHDIEYNFTVSALTGNNEEDEGPNAPKKSATPTQHAAIFSENFENALDNWTIPTNEDNFWSVDSASNPVAHVAYSSEITHMRTSHTGLQDYSASVDFQIDAWNGTNAKTGLIARYSNNGNGANGIAAYYNQANKKFEIAHVNNGVLISPPIGRSAELGREYNKPAPNEDDLWFPTVPELDTNQSYRLRFDLDGQTLRLWLDDPNDQEPNRLIASALLDGEPTQGPAGLFSRRQDVSFDNFEMRDFSLYGNPDTQ